MRKPSTATLAIWIALGIACANHQSSRVDILIRNARVYTVNDLQPWAEAVAIRGDRIVWVGSDAEADQQHGDRTRVIDAEGRLLLPGFIDSHNHIRSGNWPNSLNLQGAATLEEIQDLIREFARANPELPWIGGGGWAYTALPGDGLPRAEYLTGLTDERPAYFISYDAHTAWLNREAMEAIGLTRGSELAKQDVVVVDSLTGEPTGVVHGVVSLGSANKVLNRLWEQLPEDDGADESLEASLAQALGYGITTIVAPQTSVDGLSTFVQARDSGILKSRLEIALFHPIGTTEADLVEFAKARQQFDDDQMRVSAIKLYIDDVIEAHTAAMLEPYSDMPEEIGKTFYSVVDFNALVARLDAAGYQLFVHAIGDRGIQVALDAFEHAHHVNGKRDSRHQLVHVEVVSAEDIPRFHELGVVACMQPRHAMPGGIGQWVKAVGPERVQRALPWRSLHDAGAVLAFSSDWDVTEMDPMIGIYTAVTRKALDGSPPGGWIPEQTVSLETAIRAYTLDGAYANFADQNRGSVAVGKYADLVLLSADLFEIPHQEILDTKVVLTMVGGSVVYRAP
jgi:predicted amidohydrolase YtcJ